MRFLTWFLFLRYGWLCSPVPKTFSKLSMSMPFSQSEGTLKSFSINMESTYGIGRQFEDKSEEYKENNVSEVTAAIVAEKIVNGPVDLVVYFLLTFYVLVCFWMFLFS